MLSYNDLSVGQKKWVDLVEACELIKPNQLEVTYKQIQEIHQYLTEQRNTNKKFKVSKPLWLITNNAIRRGVYAFPSSEGNSTITVEVNNSPEEILYQTELMQYNIIL
jgi:hypothetical protein